MIDEIINAEERGRIVALLVGALVGSFATFVVYGLSFSESKNNTCVAPAISVPSDWTIGDCVADDLIDGRPSDGWIVLRGRFDNGDWYGDKYRQNGALWYEKSKAFVSIHKKFSCPLRDGEAVE